MPTDSAKSHRSRTLVSLAGFVFAWILFYLIFFYVGQNFYLVVEYFFSWVRIFSCRPNMLFMGRNFSRGGKFFPCPFPLCHCLLKFVSVNNASYFDGPWSDQDVRKTTYLLKSGKLVILVRTKWVFVGLVPLWVSWVSYHHIISIIP